MVSHKLLSHHNSNHLEFNFSLKGVPGARGQNYHMEHLYDSEAFASILPKNGKIQPYEFIVPCLAIQDDQSIKDAYVKKWKPYNI